MAVDEETELDDDLVEIVLAEALESLESALWTLRAIGHGEQGPEVVDSLFRCFHSIKGNAAMAGKVQVSHFAHRIESALDIVRTAARPLNATEARSLVEAVDLLHPLIEGGGPPAELEPLKVQLNTCLAQLEDALGSAEQTPSATFAGPESAPDSGAVETDGDAHGGGASAKLRVDAQSIVDSMTIAGELFQIDERLKFFVHSATKEQHEQSSSETERLGGLTQLSREFDSAIDKLYEQLLDIQRVSVSQLVGPLERSVRDICRKTGKDIQLVTEGRELRIDKSVVQVLKDPLMHMVRNAADHGVETAEERANTDKPTMSSITLAFEDRDDMVVVTLKDDGRGIDHERVREKIVSKGLVDARAAAALSKDELIEYIFAPGFSTAATVSDLSGRGVGMDVVHSQILGAGGVIDTATELGSGSTFILQVPKLGSPVVDGLALRSGASIYLVPLRNVLCFVARAELRLVSDPGGAVGAMFQGKAYRLCHLPGRPGIECLRSARTIGVLIEDRKGNRAVLIVDEVLGRRKALSQALTYDACVRHRAANVAIMGDGKMGFAIAVEEFLDPSLMMMNDARISLELEEASEYAHTGS